MFKTAQDYFYFLMNNSNKIRKATGKWKSVFQNHVNSSKTQHLSVSLS